MSDLPIQPIFIDRHGVARFQCNSVFVNACLFAKIKVSNVKSSVFFDSADKLQAMQLLGCTLDEVCSHPAATDEFKAKVDEAVNKARGLV